MAEAIQPLGRTHFGDAANTGNVLTTEEATTLLKDWVENERLRLHMQQVGAVMKAWALQKEGATEEEAHQWWLAGLLHDADWEKYPGDHCRVIVEELERRNIDPARFTHLAFFGGNVDHAALLGSILGRRVGHHLNLLDGAARQRF